MVLIFGGGKEFFPKAACLSLISDYDLLIPDFKLVLSF